MAVTSRKIKRVAGAVPAPIGPNDRTLERQRRDRFQVITAPRMPDEQISRDKTVKARKQACRIGRMEREGTLTRN